MSKLRREKACPKYNINEHKQAFLNKQETLNSKIKILENKIEEIEQFLVYSHSLSLEEGDKIFKTSLKDQSMLSSITKANSTKIEPKILLDAHFDAISTPWESFVESNSNKNSAKARMNENKHNWGNLGHLIL